MVAEPAALQAPLAVKSVSPRRRSRSPTYNALLILVILLVLRENYLNKIAEGIFLGPMAQPSGSPQAQQLPGSSGGGGELSPTALIDTRSLGKLRQFDGKEESWGTWSFVARSYLNLLSMDYDK